MSFPHDVRLTGAFCVVIALLFFVSGCSMLGWEIRPADKNAQNASQQSFTKEPTLQKEPLSARERAKRRVDLAQEYLRTNTPVVALKEAQSAVQIDPGYPFSHLLVAIAWDTLGDVPQASASYAKALDLAPDDPVVLANIGSFECKQGQTASGLKKLKMVLSQTLVESRERVYMAAGQCALKSGDLVAADNFLSRAIELAPNSVFSWMAMFDLVIKKGQLNKAREIQQRFMDAPSLGPEVLEMEARIEQKAGRSTQAQKALFALMEKYPNSDSARRLKQGIPSD